MFVHTREKPFHCEVCQKGFIERNDYERHKITHTGTKPFYCDICKNGFNRKSDMVRHKLMKHRNGIVSTS